MAIKYFLLALLTIMVSVVLSVPMTDSPQANTCAICPDSIKLYGVEAGIETSSRENGLNVLCTYTIPEVPVADSMLNCTYINFDGLLNVTASTLGESALCPPETEIVKELGSCVAT
ncbi:hypothetical protein F5880DRAFT_1506137 [Lentinula raphanica]|nr:hypothetical protein F5880DRAFT_1506137 [Lentinula raphanica]